MNNQPTTGALTEKQVKAGESKVKRDKMGRILPGYSLNPEGLKPKTKEEKLIETAIKKATNELIKDYTDKLASALPQISPVLINLAQRGDLGAIKEINDRVMGKATTIIDANIKTLDINQLIDSINEGKYDSDPTKFPEIE